MIYDLVFKFSQNNQDSEGSVQRSVCRVLEIQDISTFIKRAPSASEGLFNHHTAAAQTSTLCYLKQKEATNTQRALLNPNRAESQT